MKSTPISWLLVLTVACLLGACASTPTNKPDAALAKAHYAISQAQQNGVGQATSKMLYSANQKLKQARQLAHKKSPTQKDYDQARRLADEAALDAQLAAARSQAKQAQAQTQQVLKSVEALKKALKQQSQSGTGSRP